MLACNWNNPVCNITMFNGLHDSIYSPCKLVSLVCNSNMFLNWHSDYHQYVIVILQHVISSCCNCYQNRKKQKNHTSLRFYSIFYKTNPFINDRQKKNTTNVQICNIFYTSKLLFASELEINIIAFANSLVLFCVWATIDDYCSIVSK